jgi:hypothetical protein
MIESCSLRKSGALEGTNARGEGRAGYPRRRSSKALPQNRLVSSRIGQGRPLTHSLEAPGIYFILDMPKIVYYNALERLRRHVGCANFATCVCVLTRAHTARGDLRIAGEVRRVEVWPS